MIDENKLIKVMDYIRRFSEETAIRLPCAKSARNAA